MRGSTTRTKKWHVQPSRCGCRRGLHPHPPWRGTHREARSSKYTVPMGCARHAHTDARPVCWDTTVAFVVRPPMPMLFNGQAPPRASFDGRMGNVGEKPDIGCLGSNAHTGIYMRGVLVRSSTVTISGCWQARRGYSFRTTEIAYLMRAAGYAEGVRRGVER